LIASGRRDSQGRPPPLLRRETRGGSRVAKGTVPARSWLSNRSANDTARSKAFHHVGHVRHVDFFLKIKIRRAPVFPKFTSFHHVGHVGSFFGRSKNCVP